jgi:DNA-directed RNA polymerase subunit RPC12/RpoP
MAAYRCPVCDGKGLVPNGFYAAVGVNYWSSSSTTPETCRACGGTGLVFDRAENVGSTIQQAKVSTCCWTETEECWETQCGHSFVFTADGPTENGMVFCPYCGGKLTTIG